MHMHEKNGAFVAQGTSAGHLNLSCAILCLDSSVFIVWNRYSTKQRMVFTQGFLL
jgi:hypothetical protein